MKCFEQVVKSGGPLSLKARLAQASLLNALKRPKEALGVLDKILDSNPDPNLRYAVIVEKGDTLFAQGTQDPENYKSAIAAWRQISSNSKAPKIWSHQALAKMGAAYEKLGNYRCRARLLLWGLFRRSESGGPGVLLVLPSGLRCRTSPRITTTLEGGHRRIREDREREWSARRGSSGASQSPALGEFYLGQLVRDHAAE